MNRNYPRYPSADTEHVIALHFEASPSSNDDQVRPLVDGADLLHIAADDSLGVDPPQFFRQPPLGLAGRLLIGRCSCGVVGCADVQVAVTVTDRSVTWQLGTERLYHFDKQQYSTCFEHASMVTTWESVGRTAERLVSLIEFSTLAEQGYRFEWASTRIAPARVTLSFSKNGAQQLFDVEWNGLQAEDAAQQVRRWAARYA